MSKSGRRIGTLPGALEDFLQPGDLAEIGEYFLGERELKGPSDFNLIPQYGTEASEACQGDDDVCYGLECFEFASMGGTRLLTLFLEEQAVYMMRTKGNPEIHALDGEMRFLFHMGDVMLKSLGERCAIGDGVFLELDVLGRRCFVLHLVRGAELTWSEAGHFMLVETQAGSKWPPKFMVRMVRSLEHHQRFSTVFRRGKQGS